MNTTIYTWGYSNIEQDVFLATLWRFQREIDLPVLLVDVRRRHCRSHNGPWCTWDGMSGTIKALQDDGCPIALWQADALSNPYGASPNQLRKYKKDLQKRTTWRVPYDDMSFALFELCGELWRVPARAVILMCVEGKPYKVNRGVVCYESPNCHRVYVADTVREIMGHEWGVEHLET